MRYQPPPPAVVLVKPRVGASTPAFRDVLKPPLVTPRPVAPKGALPPVASPKPRPATAPPPTHATGPKHSLPSPPAAGATLKAAQAAHADRAQAHAHHEHGRLERREALNTTEEERQEHRHLGLIAEHLVAPPPPPPTLVTQPSAPPPPRIDPERALAMIERVQRYERAGRPGLQLSLGKSLGGDVELERLAKGVVSVRVRGRSGPLPTAVVRQLRTALAQQGLKLGAFIEA